MELKSNQITELANNGSKLLDVTEVAQKFKISKRGVWRAVARGDLSVPVRIGRCARWFLADIVKFAQMLLERRKAKSRGAVGE